MQQAEITINQLAKLPSLEPLKNLVAPEMAMVNQMILELAESSKVELISTCAKYLINSGGKRIRPMLTIACAKLLGYQGQRCANLAAAVEFIHSATLLHDDVVDESDMRRSLPTANRLFGNKASILVGDFLLSRAFSIMVEDGSLEVLRILSEASAIIAEGEVMQLVREGDISITFEDYRQIISAKTAQLFAASCEIGGALVENKEIQNNLADFGMNLGLAFQILDDCLDYAANEILLGKRTGDDLRDKKITLPVILCLEIATIDEQIFIQKLFDKNENLANDEEYRQILGLMQKYDIVSKCEDIARQYAEKAEIALGRLPNNAIRNILQETLEFCIIRGY